MRSHWNRRPWWLAGAEGAFFDPQTGDFLFSTWNLDRPERLVLVSGFSPAAPR